MEVCTPPLLGTLKSGFAWVQRGLLEVLSWDPERCWGQPENFPGAERATLTFAFIFAWSGAPRGIGSRPRTVPNAKCHRNDARKVIPKGSERDPAGAKQVWASRRSPAREGRHQVHPHIHMLWSTLGVSRPQLAYRGNALSRKP